MPPPPRVVQQRDPQRGRVDRAVVDRREREAAGRVDVRRAAHLVRDLAGRLGPVAVDDGALSTGEHAQRPRGELGPERQHHPCRPDRVTAEQREVPRGSGAGEDVGAVLGVGQEQVLEVGEAGRDGGGEARVLRLDLHRRPGHPRGAGVGVEAGPGRALGLHPQRDHRVGSGRHADREGQHGGGATVAGGDRCRSGIRRDGREVSLVLPGDARPRVRWPAGRRWTRART